MCKQVVTLIFLNIELKRLFSSIQCFLVIIYLFLICVFKGFKCCLNTILLFRGLTDTAT